jgi:hypothetical protein
MIAPRPAYVPREQWSPSGLSHDRACRRSYALRYLEGRKEIELSWPEAEALPEPPKAPKGASAVEQERAKAAKKAWNKKRRPACGKASHGIQEAYFRQGVAGLWHPPMAWLDLAEAFHTRPGEILLPGLALMPAPRECLDALIEDPIRLQWEFLPDHLRAQVEADPITFSGFKDLVLRTGEGWSLKDLKTTYDFASLAFKSPEQLATDEQANLYALDVMQRFNLNRLECDWIYCRTEGKPSARPVHFTILRSDAEEIVTALVERALELRLVMRACPQLSATDSAAVRAALEKPAEDRTAAELALIQRSTETDEKRHLYVMALPATPEACDDFGGRDCHASRGGPCDARLSYVALINRRMSAAKPNKGPTPMMTEEQKARLAELRAITDRNFKQKRELADLEKLDTEPAAEGEAPAEEKPEVAAVAETKAEPKAETPAATKPAAPAKPAKAEAPATGAVVCTFDGVSVELPAKSPLAKAIQKVCSLRKAYDAAVAGEL